MRGVIPNPTGLLTPGAFARTRIARGEAYKTLLVPDKAVGTEQTERYLLVVGKDDVVVSKTVKTGALFGSLRAIISGLDPQDRIVVNGLQKAQPGWEGHCPGGSHPGGSPQRRGCGIAARGPS